MLFFSDYFPFNAPLSSPHISLPVIIIIFVLCLRSRIPLFVVVAVVVVVVVEIMIDTSGSSSSTSFFLSFFLSSLSCPIMTFQGRPGVESNVGRLVSL